MLLEEFSGKGSHHIADIGERSVDGVEEFIDDELLELWSKIVQMGTIETHPPEQFTRCEFARCEIGGRA